jgi:hypothetical protein
LRLYHFQNEERAPKRHSEKISFNDALSFLQQAFEKRLEFMVNAVVKAEAAKKEPPSDMQFYTLLVKRQQEWENQKRVPGGIYDDANQLGQYLERTVANLYITVAMMLLSLNGDITFNQLAQ